jgi:hypothetical protein
MGYFDLALQLLRQRKHSGKNSQLILDLVLEKGLGRLALCLAGFVLEKSMWSISCYDQHNTIVLEDLTVVRNHGVMDYLDHHPQVAVEGNPTRSQPLRLVWYSEAEREVVD